MAYYMNRQFSLSKEGGHCLKTYYGWRRIRSRQMPCHKKIESDVFCELPSHTITWTSRKREDFPKLQLSQTLERTKNLNTSLSVCPSGHITHTFLACDARSSCWNKDTFSASSCTAELTPLPPSFVCQDKVEQVPYSLVCDHKKDCYDNSDEQFCQYRACRFTTQCKNKQTCDKIPHCTDLSDDLSHYCGPPKIFGKYYLTTRTSPCIVNFRVQGGFKSKLLKTSTCPDTHFQCELNGYCLPVFVKCNSVYDCPLHEDEMHCDRYICSGFYRCRASSVCVHPQHVCDGMYQCPQQDDELLCDDTCPEQCTCYGHAFFCDSVIDPPSYPDLRFLDASDSGLQYADVSTNTLLIYLRLARCGIVNLTLLHLPNLQNLDLSENLLTFITDQHLSLIPHMQILTLSNNPLPTLIQHTLESAYQHQHLESLDVSRVIMKELDMSTLNIFPNLVTLNLTNCSVNRIISGGSQALRYLSVLDLRGNSMKYFSGNIYQSFKKLKKVYADTYKLCCEEILPESFPLDQCFAPSDEISSCQSLLRSNIYRAVLVIFSILAIAGNMISVHVRIITNKIRANMGFDIFVTNLCISDLLMGLYLAIIGLADFAYHSTYLWNDIKWKKSIACQTAGFSSLLSSEVSAFIICVITLDRVLVLRFPFSQLHFHRVSAMMTCVGIWIAGLILAAIPLLPMTSHWEFYGQNGICIPLPVTRKDYPGQTFAFNVMIVLNFVLFLLISVGQAAIYQSVQQNKLSDNSSSTRNSKDSTLARRLLTIAVTDFLCWFPIGVLGLMANSGHAVSSEVNVAMAIFVLPLNSAINPFLYTLNMVMERLQLKRQQRLQQQLLLKHS